MKDLIPKEKKSSVEETVSFYKESLKLSSKA